MAAAEEVDMTDPRLQRCGFAKLEGPGGFEYFIRKYEVILGRRSSSESTDVVLGDNMNLSRKHATITFNFAKGVFELTVLGKNGVTIDGVLYTPNSSPATLTSQVLLAMGDRQFYFLLPKLAPEPRVRAKAPKKAAGEDAPSASGRATLDLNQPPPQEAGTGGGGAQHDATDTSFFDGLPPGRSYPEGGSYAEGAGTSGGLAAAFLEQQRQQQQQQERQATLAAIAAQQAAQAHQPRLPHMAASASGGGRAEQQQQPQQLQQQPQQQQPRWPQQWPSEPPQQSGVPPGANMSQALGTQVTSGQPQASAQSFAGSLPAAAHQTQLQRQLEAQLQAIQQQQQRQQQQQQHVQATVAPIGNFAAPQHQQLHPMPPSLLGNSLPQGGYSGGMPVAAPGYGAGYSTLTTGFEGGPQQPHQQPPQ